MLGVANGAVLHGFSMNVTNLDFQKGDVGVGVMPDPHLETLGFATNMVFKALVCGGIEVPVVVGGGALALDAQQAERGQTTHDIIQPI